MYPNSPQTSNGAPRAHTDIGDALEFAAKRFEPRLLVLEHEDVKAPVIIAPNGAGAMEVYSVKDQIDEWRERPERRRGTIHAHDLDSFIALVNRDKLADSVIFARNDDKPRLTAVLDFHDNREDQGDEAQPAFCEDRIRYDFPLSDEWKAWTEHAGRENAMDQGTFAAFVEDHVFDVGEPAAAGATAQAFALKLGVSFAGPQRLMEVSRGLAVRVDEKFSNKVNLATGETQFAFTSEHKDANGAPLVVPAAFHLMIPIFKGGALCSIPVRLRYRTDKGSVVWFYELHRADLFKTDAVNDTLKRVRMLPEAHQEAKDDEISVKLEGPGGGCGLPVYLGAPPAVKTDG